jgi:RNA polymerase sigma-54 factor
MAGLSQSIQQGQHQSLVMTQQLQQSIKLLQLSAADLEAFVMEEMEKNPLLQEGEGKTEETPEEPKAESEEPTKEIDFTKDEIAENSSAAEEFSDRSERLAPEYSQQTSTHSGEGENLIEKMAHEKPSLHDHLLEHLHFSTDDIQMRLIGMHLIDLVTPAGYLPDNYLELMETLKCSEDQLEITIDLLQQCEPAGLCARNVSECLALQLKECGEYTQSMQALVENLDLLGNAEFSKLQKACGVPRDELQEMVAELRELNPKPGIAFDFEETQAVQPDVFVRRNGEDWEIELNPAALPKVLVNNDYFTKLSGSIRDKEEKSYLGEQLNHANWLVKSLDQRANTMLKTTREIVKQQSRFLLHGVRYLKPLTLKEVADAIEMHESTISRITSNKYLSYAGTLYELKYFFTSSLNSSFGGDDISSKAVQHLIQQLVDAETDVKSVLSDDAIAQALDDQGMKVARRTVAKYRDILKIPSSAQRKRVFKQQL